MGIKESSVYNHYKNKAAILTAILDYYTESFVDSEPSFEVIEGLANKHRDAREFWLSTAEMFMANIPTVVESIRQLLANEMYLNPIIRNYIRDKMFVQQKTLTKNTFMYMYDKGLIPKVDFEREASQYVYMLYGLETENRIKLLSGIDEAEIKRQWEIQVGYFIDRLKDNSNVNT